MCQVWLSSCGSAFVGKDVAEQRLWFSRPEATVGLTATKRQSHATRRPLALIAERFLGTFQAAVSQLDRRSGHRPMP